MTENVQMTLISAAFATVPSIIGLITLLATNKTKADVKENTAVTKSTHKLVNGRHTGNLKTIMEDKAKIALLDATPEAIAAADSAKREYNDHIASLGPATQE